MEMKLGSPFKERLTSKKKKEVASMMSQQRKKRRKAGKKPPKAVLTGSASIPAPMVVPATIKIPPSNFILVLFYNLGKNSTPKSAMSRKKKIKSEKSARAKRSGFPPITR